MEIVAFSANVSESRQAPRYNVKKKKNSLFLLPRSLVLSLLLSLSLTRSRSLELISATAYANEIWVWKRSPQYTRRRRHTKQVDAVTYAVLHISGSFCAGDMLTHCWCYVFSILAGPAMIVMLRALWWKVKMAQVFMLEWLLVSFSLYLYPSSKQHSFQYFPVRAIYKNLKNSRIAITLPSSLHASSIACVIFSGTTVDCQKCQRVPEWIAKFSVV